MYWDKPLDYNPLNQLNEAVKNINTILHHEKLHHNSTGVLAFAGQHAIIDIIDRSRHKILNPTEIVNWIKDVKYHDKNGHNNKQSIVKAISKYIVPNYHDEATLIIESYQPKTGLRCDNCHSFNYHVNKNAKTVKCLDCGKKELKITMTKRMTKEFAGIYFNKSITSRAIYTFLDYKISKHTISSYLKDNLISIGSGKNRRYEYEKLNFNHLFEK